MSEDKDPFEGPVRATLAEMDQQQVATGVIYAGDAFKISGFNPFSVPDPSQTIEAERKQARAELRDRFAGYALIGLLAAGDHHAYNRDEMAIEAWRQADAMLKARAND